VNDECVGLREEHSAKLSPVVRQALLQCAESCERALSNYATEVALDTGHELFGDLLRAIATVQTTVALLEVEDSRRELAFRLTARACTAAAARCRQAGFDESLLRCAVACDRAADEAEVVLTSLAH
jgi:hypothetical protein